MGTVTSYASVRRYEFGTLQWLLAILWEGEMAHDRIRTLNKHVTNPLLRTFARSSRGPFAVMHHVGRRSGKSYETTIMVWPLNDGFVIALTYGSEVDWYRNLRAAEQCTLLWHGRNYTVGKPEPIDAAAALPAFPRPFRLILQRLGTTQFVFVKRIEA